MCDCNLIAEGEFSPILFSQDPYRLIHAADGIATTLLSDFRVHGVINYASITEIEAEHGVNRGYLIIIGEK